MVLFRNCSLGHIARPGTIPGGAGFPYKFACKRGVQVSCRTEKSSGRAMEAFEIKNFVPCGEDIALGACTPAPDHCRNWPLRLRRASLQARQDWGFRVQSQTTIPTVPRHRGVEGV